ncbi:MAG: type II secretion system minor pseudopilin GspK [Thermodesulfobacteriota bacterium]|jgi:general secretion pathway protein K
MRKQGGEKKGGKGEKGVALVLTLLILTLLVVTGLELNRAVRVEATLAGNFRDLTQAGYIAQSGVEVARALLQNNDPVYDGLDERWAQFETLSFLSSQYFPEGYFTGRITDENGKLNPNGLIDSNGNVNLKKRAQLERLLTLLGHPVDWIEALLDWMDTDDQPRVRGAEREYYLSLKKPYPAKNGPLDLVEELLLVKGVEPAILYGKEGREGVKNYLTVNSDGQVNINTASLPVLMSLDANVDKMMAQAVLAYRIEKPFKGIEALRSVPGWDAVYSRISSEITVRSNFFSVEVLGNYREARSIVQTVIRRDGRRTKVLFWKAG